MLTFNLSFLGPYKENFNQMTLVGLIFVLVGFAIWRTKTFLCYERKDDELIEDEESTLIKSSTTSTSPIITCAACGINYEPRSRTSSGDSLYGNAPDAFYDRVIVLSLDG